MILNFKQSLEAAVILIVIAFAGSVNCQNRQTSKPATKDVTRAVSRTVCVPVAVEDVPPGEKPAFSVNINSLPVGIKQISSPPAEALQIIVINISNQPAGELIKQFGSLKELNTVKPVWIEVGNITAAKKTADWKLSRHIDFESAVSHAESLFKRSRARRQSLLVITNAEDFLSDAAWTKLVSPSDLSGQAVTVISVGENATGAGTTAETARTAFYKSNLEDEKTAVPPLDTRSETSVGKWIGKMKQLYVISFDVPDEILREDFTVEIKAEVGGRTAAFRSFPASRILQNSQSELNEVSELSEVSELGEVLDYLSRLPDFSELKLYKSAADPAVGNDDAAPGITGLVVYSGQMNDRLQKLSKTVFALHKLGGHLRAVVFRSDAATVFTWKLISVSLSSKTLDILDDNEITALLAHEVGHLYFASELARARLDKNARASRVAELKCDIIALMTLEKLGIPKSSLTGALKKIIAARTAAGLESFAPESPSLEDRIALAENFDAVRATTSK